MLWYMIEGFNGYEINEEGIVRSMKMMNAKPGHCLKLYTDGVEPYYVLSNNCNKRVKITQRELLDIVFNSGLPLKPRNENAVYMGSRNKRFYFDDTIKNKDGQVQNIKMDFSKFIKDE